jgi:hypothetical protein
LLTGAALCALGAAPAMAQPTHPATHITALHAGHVVNKTNLHDLLGCGRRCSQTYKYGVYTSQPADAPPKTHLYGTYYRWNSAPNGYYTLCSNPKQHIQVGKKSVYAKINKGIETYSYGCPSGPTVFYGDRWTNGTGVTGDVDTFNSLLIGRFKGPSGEEYKGSLKLDVYVSIE